HPNIINMKQIFSPVLTNIIPFLAAVDARVLFSTYHLVEVYALDEVTKSTGRYTKPGAGNFCELVPPFEIEVEGVFYKPNQFNLILRCEGNGLACVKKPLSLSTTGTGRVLSQALLGLFANKIRQPHIGEMDNHIEGLSEKIRNYFS
ncbi:MAG: hypothetical protein PSV35_08945, partial [bacterium]|nr:hypothetical protein [bacterium]